jgi:hypothetical protein
MRRLRLSLAMSILVVLAAACSAWGESEADAVRRAVVAHELDGAGLKVAELIVRLSPNEFRADFGHGTRMVWLVSPAYQRWYREGEYFRLRDPALSYLFLKDVRYDESSGDATAQVDVYLGNGEPVSKELALHKENGAWSVTSDRVVSGTTSIE